MQKRMMKKSAILFLILFLFGIAFFAFNAINTNAEALLSASLTATPETKYVEESSTLTWSSTAAISCIGSGFNTNGATSGSVTVSPSFTTTYEIECFSATDENVFSSVTITVIPTHLAVSLTATPATSYAGEIVALTWSTTFASECVGTGFFTGGATSGRVEVTPITTTTYSINCNDIAGNWISDSATVTILPPPDLTLSTSLMADPTLLYNTVNGYSTLTWSSTGADACDGLGFSTGRQTEGYFIVSPTSTTTYTLICYNYATNQQSTDSITVIIPVTAITTFTASPNPVSYNTGTTLSWSAAYADTCTALSDNWDNPSPSATSGTYNTGPLTSTTTYEIECLSNSPSSNDDGYDTKSVTVTVQPSSTPSISVIPSDLLNCGSTPLGTLISCGSFTVRNSGTVDASGSISGVSSPFSCPDCSFGYNLGVGETEIFPFTFTPTSAGTISKTITFSVTGGNNVYRTITGTGTPTTTKHDLTINRLGDGTGTVTGTGAASFTCTASTCTYTFDEGTEARLTATASDGSIFAGWGGACFGIPITVPCVLTMNSAKTITVTFNKVVPTVPKYPLTVTITGTGTLSDNAGNTCSSSCIWQIDQNSNVTLTANPGTGLISGACSGTGGCSFNMSTSAKSVAVTFLTTPQISVTPTSLNCGSVQVGDTTSCGSFAVSNIGSGTFDGSASVSSPFSCGGDNCNYYDLDNTATAQNLPITFTPTSAGSFTGTVTFTGDGGATRTVTGTGIPPNTPVQTYNLTITNAGTGNGIVARNPESTISCGTNCWTYNSGQSVTLTATASNGSVFAGWGGACLGVPSTVPCVLTMSSNKAVTATFSEVTVPYLLTVSKSGTGQGTVTSSPAGINCLPYQQTCSASFSGTVTLTATPYGTSTFTSWSGCTSTNGNICTVTMSSAKTVTATFTGDIPTCAVTNASWSTSSVTEGTSIAMTAKQNGNCDGKTATFNIKRGTSSIATYTKTFSGVSSATQLWTAEPASSTAYYFTASTTLPSSSATSGDLFVTEPGQEPVDPCLGITLCSDYTSSTMCGTDSCGVGDMSAPSLVDCTDPNVDCTCAWNSATSTCSSSWTITGGNCGNGVIETGETCDTGLTDPFNGLKCNTFDNFTGGNLTCDPTTCTIKTTSCIGGVSGTCGNGVINTGETCDTGLADPFKGLKCSNFDNFKGGILTCNSTTCTISTSNCTGGTTITLGSCTITQDTSDDCSDGFLSFSWTGIWTGSTAPEEATCEAGGTDTIPCPAQIQLPFISTLSIVAIIVIAILIYFLISKKKTRKKR